LAQDRDWIEEAEGFLARLATSLKAKSLSFSKYGFLARMIHGLEQMIYLG
jgi:hypothetical protein